ncbi:MAG: outer membrane lipoprotein carrier protein LolA, partial [bacterium]
MKLARVCCFWGAGLLALCVSHAAQPVDKAKADAVQPNPAVDAEMDAALDGIDDRVSKIEDLRAKFEQRKSSVMLRKPMVSSGEVIARSDVVLWRTQQPRKADMRVGGGEIRLLYPEDKLLEIYPIQNARGMAGGPLPRLSKLREQFTFSRASDQIAGGTTLQVVLTPKSEEVRSAVATVQVSIDTKVPCVTKIVMTDPDGEQTSIE